MRLPKISEILKRLNLGSLTARIFRQPNLQTGTAIKIGLETPDQKRTSGKGFGGASPEPQRPRTATPHQAEVLKGLTERRRQIATPDKPTKRHDSLADTAPFEMPGPSSTASASTTSASSPMRPSTAANNPSKTVVVPANLQTAAMRPSTAANNPSKAQSPRSILTTIVQSLTGKRPANSPDPSKPSGQRRSAVQPTTATPDVRAVSQSVAASAVQKASPHRPSEGGKSTMLDKLQFVGDVAGVFDPTGVVDGVNALVSVKRAIDEPDRRGEHLRNALISGVSILPLIGDLAKLGKVGKAEKAAATGGKAPRRTAPAGSTPSMGGLMSRVLGGVASAAPVALAGASTVFSRADSSQRPSLLQQVFGLLGGQSGHSQEPTTAASPTISGQASPPTRRRWRGNPPPNLQSPLRTHDSPASTTSSAAPLSPSHPQPAGAARSKTSLFDRATSWMFGRRVVSPAAGVAPVDQPTAPENQSSATRRKRPRGFGQRMKSAAAGVSEVIATAIGAGKDHRAVSDIPPHSSTSSANALGQGTNFGDVMGGKKTLEDAEKEAEGNRKLAATKEKLAEVIQRVTGRLGGLALGAVALFKSLDKINAAVLAKQRALEYVSPGHAYAGAQQDVAKILRDMEAGRKTSGTFKQLTQAQIDFQRALAPMSSAMTNLGNRILTMATKGLTLMVLIAEHIPGIAQAVKSAAESLEAKEKESIMPWVSLIEESAQRGMRQPRAPRQL